MFHNFLNQAVFFFIALHVQLQLAIYDTTVSSFTYATELLMYESTYFAKSIYFILIPLNYTPQHWAFTLICH